MHSKIDGFSYSKFRFSITREPGSALFTWPTLGLATLMA